MGLLDSEVDPNVEMKEILHLEKLDVNLYRGVSPAAPRWGRMYGGQLIAQSISAARATLPAYTRLHSTHCYFHRPGDDETPMLYYVEPIKDTFKYATRRITAVQHGHVVFTAMASFTKHAQPHAPDTGMSYQQPLTAHYPAWVSAATSTKQGYQQMVSQGSPVVAEDVPVAGLRTSERPVPAAPLPVPLAAAYTHPQPFPFASDSAAPIAVGLDTATTAPFTPFSLPHPDTLPSLPEVMLALSKDESPSLSPRARRVLYRAAAQFSPFDIRWIDHQDRHPANWGNAPDSRVPIRSAYVRVRARLPPNDLCAAPDSPAAQTDSSWLHAVALSYLSDWGMIAVMAKPLALPPFSPRVQPASLDHALHVHRADFDAGEWLLFTVHCPIYAHQRGLLVGQFWDLRGRLIATVQQEALVKVRDEKSKARDDTRDKIPDAVQDEATVPVAHTSPPEPLPAAAPAPRAAPMDRPLSPSRTSAPLAFPRRVHPRNDCTHTPHASADAALLPAPTSAAVRPSCEPTPPTLGVGDARHRLPQSALGGPAHCSTDCSEAVAAARLNRVLQRQLHAAPLCIAAVSGRRRSRPLARTSTAATAPMLPDNDPSLPPSSLAVPPNLTTTATLRPRSPPAELARAYMPALVRGHGHHHGQRHRGEGSSVVANTPVKETRSQAAAPTERPLYQQPLAMNPLRDIPVAIL